VILCVGELMWDVHVEPGSTLETGERLRRFPGGAAANVAQALARRGRRVALGGTVSDDALGRGLCEALEARGIDASRVKRDHGRTGLVFLERTDGASERFVSYRPTVGSFEGCDLPEGLRALHIGALNPIAAELASLADLAAQARRDGAVVLIDVNARPLPWREGVDADAAPSLARLLMLAHAVKLSDSDLACLDRELDDAVAWLVAAGATAVVTRRGEPTSVQGPWGSVERRPPRVEVVRSVGAGDAFVSGMLEALVDGEPPVASLGAQGWSEVLDAAQRAAALHVSTMW